uniref:Uncharacterized protein n=1 Tax=Lygus hesperus TaxID=30085 RepID=A0A146L2Z0_LYGHE
MALRLIHLSLNERRKVLGCLFDLSCSTTALHQGHLDPDDDYDGVVDGVQAMVVCQNCSCGCECQNLLTLYHVVLIMSSHDILAVKESLLSLTDALVAVTSLRL